MNARYLGWVKMHGDWQVVCNGATVGECMGELLRWIRSRPAPPLASAVRPAGTHPDGPSSAQDAPHGTRNGTARSAPARGGRKAGGTR
jgi:hypothetical protein